MFRVVSWYCIFFWLCVSLCAKEMGNRTRSCGECEILTRMPRSVTARLARHGKRIFEDDRPRRNVQYGSQRDWLNLKD